MKKTLTHSILIPTCNRPGFVKSLLSSIDSQTRSPAEVVIIDQSDDDKTKHVFEAWVPKGNVQKKYIFNKIKSLILARNTGIDAAGDFDLVAFIDDDVKLKPNFTEEIVKVFEQDAEEKFAGGMGTFEGAQTKRHLLQQTFLMPCDGSGKFHASGTQTVPYGLKEFKEVEFLAGGITFWRKKIIQENKFDERLTAYGTGDDVDVSYRISRKYKNFYQPKAVCFHDLTSPGRNSNYLYRKNWIQNFYYLAQKNGVSKKAFAWCVVGHFLRDMIHLDTQRLKGDFIGTFNVLRDKIDSVAGYDEFKKDLSR